MKKIKILIAAVMLSATMPTMPVYATGNNTQITQDDDANSGHSSWWNDVKLWFYEVTH